MLVPGANIVRATADVCWETEFSDVGAGCVNADGRYDPNPPAGISYKPTCYLNNLTAATVTPESELHGVRCISESKQYGYSYCQWLNFGDAHTFCETFAGDPTRPETVGLTDWRLPNTPLEAGRLCGSGCGLDYLESWVSFGAFPLDYTCCPYLGHN